MTTVERLRDYLLTNEVDGLLANDDEMVAEFEAAIRAEERAPWCNGLKPGTTPSLEGTSEPCEHAYWDDAPWDVGEGRGQWCHPEGHGAKLTEERGRVRKMVEAMTRALAALRMPD